MDESIREVHPLPYAAPGLPSRRPLSRLFAMVPVNCLAALASLWFVPLASHLYSCTDGVKWCRMQALVFGLLAAVVLTVLVAVTTALMFGDDTHGSPSRATKVAAWLPLGLVMAVLLALLIAAGHNTPGS